VGGYVVGPGSSSVGGCYVVVDRSAVAELPSWVSKVLVPKPRPVQLPERYGCPDAYIRAALEGEAERVRAAAVGSRNDTLNLSAFLLGQLVGAGRLPEQEAWHALQTAAAGFVGVQGFTELEMHQTIKSGLAGGARKRRR
jgi:hypothetical protein